MEKYKPTKCNNIEKTNRVEGLGKIHNDNHISHAGSQLTSRIMMCTFERMTPAIVLWLRTDQGTLQSNAQF